MNTAKARKEPVFRTSEASRTNAEDMNRIFNRINVLVYRVSGTNPALKDDWNENDIVDSRWVRAVDYVKQYASEYAEDITYSSHYKNLNNIEMACWFKCFGEPQNKLPIMLQEGNTWQ